MIAESDFGLGCYSSKVPGIRVRFQDDTDQAYFPLGTTVYNDINTHAKSASIQVPYDGKSSEVWVTLFTGSTWQLGDVITTDTIFFDGIKDFPAPGDPPPSGFSKHRESVNSTSDKRSFTATGLSSGNSYLTKVKYRSNDSPEVESDVSPWNGIIYSP